MANVVRVTSPNTRVFANVINALKAQVGAGAYFHLDKSEVVPTLPAATDLPSAVALVNQLEKVYQFHAADAVAHQAADGTNLEALAAANPGAGDGGLAGAAALANDLKAKFNAHRTQAGVHFNDDAANAVAAAAATDLATLQTLANGIRTAMLAHLASGPAAPSLRVVSG